MDSNKQENIILEETPISEETKKFLEQKPVADIVNRIDCIFFQDYEGLIELHASRCNDILQCIDVYLCYNEDHNNILSKTRDELIEFMTKRDYKIVTC